MTRQELFAWCMDQYGTEPEYPWKDRNAVLRHKDNKKWYGVILETGKNKLGIATRSWPPPAAPSPDSSPPGT